MVAAVLVFGEQAWAYRMTAWVVTWDPASAESMRRYGSSIEETNPVWFVLSEAGEIVPRPEADDYRFRAALSGTHVVPTLQNNIDGVWRGDVVAAIVEDPVRRAQHVTEIVDLVIARGYSGIDIDYERLPATSRDHYSAFIAELSQALRNQARRLSVAVHARTTTSSGSSGAAAHDYQVIGYWADLVKVMAYDKHWEGSEPGPITPLDWLEEVVLYAIARIPEHKLYVALPFYGYDWGAPRTRSMTYERAMSIVAEKGVTVQRDANGEPWFTYDGRTVYFQDVHSYRRKVERVLQRFPSVAGFAYWRAGAEDPAVWPAVRETAAGTGAIYTVNTTDDNDEPCTPEYCTLRAAMEAANLSYIGRDIIRFDIPGEGVKRIVLNAQLPSMANILDIDGTSQPGFSGTPLIELDGSNTTGDGLRVITSASRVRGLAFVNFPAHAMFVVAHATVIEGCRIGVSDSGEAAPVGGVGILVSTGRVNRIGGFEPWQGNVIAAGGSHGIEIRGSDSVENAIVGNNVGAEGGNAGHGVVIEGRLTVLLDNVIARNQRSGVFVSATADRMLLLDSQVYRNSGDGVTVLSPAKGHRILDTSFTENGGLAIDHDDDGETSSPVTIVSAAAEGAQVRIAGTLSGLTGDVVLQTFTNAACDPSGSGEAQRLIDTTTIRGVTEGMPFDRLLTADVVTRPYITIVATPASGTAEASACRKVSPGPAASLSIGAPATAVAGETVSITVTAEDSDGDTATGYRGTVHFTSSDGAAVLPADTAFTAADGGVRAFEVRFGTAGAASITVTDTTTGTITATTGLTIKRSTSTVLQSSPNPSHLDQPVTLTATVDSPSAGPFAGDVVFRAGATILGTATVAENGLASLAVDDLAEGSHTLVAEYMGDASSGGSTSAPHAHVVGGRPFGAPPSVSATAGSTSSVTVTWLAVGDAVHYEIHRAAHGQPFALAGTSPSPSYSEASLAANTTWLYKVRAVRGDGTRSPFSAVDAATTIVFTDAEPSLVKAAHFHELRLAVNAMRQAAGLASTSFTGASLTGAPVRAVHLTELRAALHEARAAIGLAPLAYADATITPGATPVRAAHVLELRDGVR